MIQSRHVLLMGPPVSGKSTQALMLAETMHVKLLDSGDILREEVRSHSALGLEADAYMGRGDLVPSRLVEEVVDKRLAQPDVQAGFVLNGFPRKLEEAAHFIDWSRTRNVHDLVVLGLQVPMADVLQRAAGRRICAQGHLVNIDSTPPSVPDHCDRDGTLLGRRSDDDPAVVRHRIEVYDRETEPVIQAFDAAGLYRGVDGTGSPAEVQQRLFAKLTT